MKKKILMLLIGICYISICRAQLTFDTAAVVKNNKQLYSIVISQNDKVVYNKYFNGMSDTMLFNNQSLTKSVMSILIGIAIDKKYIPSVDEKIVKYFPELARDSDKRKQNITIRQIMCQASGLWHEDLTRLDKYFALDDPSGYVLKQPLVSSPGKTFHYSNAVSHLLSVILTKATQMSTLDFANKYLFKPLNITQINWRKMRDGYYDGSGVLSVQMRTTDMNKIGMLFLNRGRSANGVKVVSDAWIRQLLFPPVKYNTDWGFSGSTYALNFYHINYLGSEVTYGLGWGGQFMFIIPRENTVITVNEDIADATATKASSLFIKRIFPLIYEELKWTSLSYSR